MSVSRAGAAISEAMRDMLIEHLDGVKVPFAVHQKYDSGLVSVYTQHRITTTNALLMRGFIRKTKSQKHTVLTHDGRLMLGKLLADYADALTRAHEMLGDHLDPEWAALFVGAVFVNAPKELV